MAKVTVRISSWGCDGELTLDCNEEQTRQWLEFEEKWNAAHPRHGQPFVEVWAEA